MSIFLIILKIIGILLLVILFLAAVILFHPFFYHIKGKAQEEISVQGYFWWLFQILRMEFKLENGDFQMQFRIFGLSGRKKKTGKNEENQESWEDEESSTAEDIPLQESQEPEKLILRQDVKEKAKQKKSSEREKVKPQKEKRHFGEKFVGLKKEFTDTGNRTAVSHLWKEFCYLLSHLKPRHLKGEIDFSAGDPAVTGEVTGALSLVPLIYRYDMHVYPDFLAGEFYIRGSLDIKGHIALFPFIVSLIRMIRDENIRRLYYKFRKQEVLK